MHVFTVCATTLRQVKQMMRQMIIEERSSSPVGSRDTLEESPSMSYQKIEASRSYCERTGTWRLGVFVIQGTQSRNYRRMASVLLGMVQQAPVHGLSSATIIQDRISSSYVYHRRTGTTFSKFYSRRKGIPPWILFSESLPQPKFT